MTAASAAIPPKHAAARALSSVSRRGSGAQRHAADAGACRRYVPWPISASIALDERLPRRRSPADPAPTNGGVTKPPSPPFTPGARGGPWLPSLDAFPSAAGRPPSVSETVLTLDQGTEAIEAATARDRHFAHSERHGGQSLSAPFHRKNLEINFKVWPRTSYLKRTSNFRKSPA